MGTVPLRVQGEDLKLLALVLFHLILLSFIYFGVSL